MEELWGKGYDDTLMDKIGYGVDAVKNLFGINTVTAPPLQGPAGSTAPSYTGSIETDPSIWDDVMATIAGAAEMPFPANDAVVTDDNFIDLVHSQLPRLTEQGSADSLNILMEKMAGGLSTDYNFAPGSSSAIDQIVANSLLQQQAVQPVAEHPRITARKNLVAAAQVAQAYNTPVNVPSIFKPQPAPVAPVYAAPGGPPNRPTSNPVSRPTYNWTQNFAAGRW